MRFELLPILDLMLDFYQKPRDFGRFQTYLQLLQGETKGDLALPIGGFNPMAKPHVLEKLSILKSLDAEKIIASVVAEMSEKQTKTPIFKVALTLSDDAAGGWTNHFTTDFDSKFKLNALISRQFCTPIFWTNEDYTTDLIRERTAEYIARTKYWFTKNRKPQTLKDHVEQEIFVAKNVFSKNSKSDCDLVFLKKYYAQNADSDDYALIFNFFYGDAVSESLGFKAFGIEKEKAGFKFVKH